MVEDYNQRIVQNLPKGIGRGKNRAVTSMVRRLPTGDWLTPIAT